MLGLDLKKLLKSSGLNIDVDKLAEESSRIPLMLEALIDQSNTQNRALKYIIGTLDEIQKKTDKAQEILSLWDKLLEEDKKRQDNTK